ncbi:MAG: type I-E CRISPR-associated protein Cse1/CasA [Lautropia sp.]|nr:type I-E CRISPR-associated protein Cse1/CasA [Lautropia sp.]
MSDASKEDKSWGNLLIEPLIRWRELADGCLKEGSLPELLTALAADSVQDFPALRPHQRHPWFAFLVQLALIALQRAGKAEPWTHPAEWQQALRALTPDRSGQPADDAWCLVAPVEMPAFLQPPVPEGSVSAWKILSAADELDMLVTSKNHDVKGARARRAQADDWIFALLSLQTQEGFLGKGNYGISRMNGGFASRPGVGIAAVGRWGRRWADDVARLLHERHEIARKMQLSLEGGYALLWLLPWKGTDSLAFNRLDPFYIEVCRRVRLQLTEHGELFAKVVGTEVPRVEAKDRNGVTGDPWTPVETVKAKALTLSAGGFDYQLMCELIGGGKYTQGSAWRLDGWPQGEHLQVIAQTIVRGQGKTEGYHERCVPVSPKVRSLLRAKTGLNFSDIAQSRIKAIADVRGLLWGCLVVLFSNGEIAASPEVKERASRFSNPFEKAEDQRFFDDLALECEVPAEQRAQQRLQWQIDLVGRAEGVLQDAFRAGPRSGSRRYKAQSAALSMFHGRLRGKKSPLPDLANYYAQKGASEQNHAGDWQHVD